MTASPAPRLGLTLGPVLFHWNGERLFDFYARIADEAPVDRVCIGEVVCSKRLPSVADSLARAVERLQASGKEVILSTLALVTLGGESARIAELGRSSPIGIEVNDISSLDAVRGQDFTVGPFVNVYNESTLAFLGRHGARRICLPPELPLASIAVLARAAKPLGVACEVIGFGRLPLAISARCYHARLHGTRKDACQFVCEHDPDGRPVDTLDGQPFLAVNGVMTMSQSCVNLVQDIGELAAAGVDAIRLSPQSTDMVAVARAFRAVIDGDDQGAAALARLGALVPFAAFSNGFLHGTRGVAFVAPEAG
ncbi:MAG: U32 family peptidase [Novosphingobium sp.]|nr:U32 family peptidase [Novosphingobium sp.]